MHFATISVVFVIAVAALAPKAAAIDWCAVQKDYCGGAPHSACKTNDFGTGACTNVETIPMSEEMKAALVDTHNTLRQQVAAGQLKRFPPAARMQEMVWDDELSYVATALTNRCLNAHDQCRSTPTDHSPGQNIAGSFNSKPETNFTALAIDSVHDWFAEHKKAHPSIVKKYPQSALMTTGHFAVMTREENPRVGCGAIKYQTVQDGNEWYGFSITCNYAGNNWYDTPMYRIGKGCSDCESMGRKCSTTYPDLCA